MDLRSLARVRARILPYLLAILAMALAPRPAFAKPGDATAAIRAANDKLRQLLAKKAAKGSEQERQLATQVTTELRDLLDIGFLAERALVDHWATMTPKQREETVGTLRQVVERNYLAQLRTNLNYKVEYLGEEQKGEDVTVRTVIRAKKKGRPVEIAVDYVVRFENGRHRVYDVITDDVSLLRNYRSQFNRIIAKEGVDGLVGRMKAKLAKNEP